MECICRRYLRVSLKTLVRGDFVSLVTVKTHVIKSSTSREVTPVFYSFNSQLFFSLASDPADGQTTSRQPPPFTLPGTLDQMSSSASPSQSSSSGKPQILDRSQSAPATMRQTSTPGLGLQELPLRLSPAENDDVTPLQVKPPPPTPPPAISPSTDVVCTSTPPADMTPESPKPGVEAQPGAAEEDAEPDKAVNTLVLPHPEEDSLVQAMEQEEAEPDTADTTETCVCDPSQAVAVKMECPPVPQPLASSEMDQPERDQLSCSDSVPSLAAALMELHELLVSNNQAQLPNRSASCSPSHQQETDDMNPEPCIPTPENTQCIPFTAITVGAGPGDAKANHAAAVSDEEPSNCTTPELSGQGEHLDVETAETVEGQRPPQHPDVSRQKETEGQDEVSQMSIFQPELELPPDPPRCLESGEPSETQPGRTSDSNTPDTLGLQTEHTSLSPLSMAVDSPEEVSGNSSNSSPPLPEAPQLTAPTPLLPSPHPFIDQFPAEHIQRIQAAGFSAMEAAEALERAHGVVELALLALLARSITVPT